MNRLDIIKSLIAQKNLKNYLEIGVENGHNFFRVKSSFKVAVDPAFAFDTARRLGKTLVNPSNLNNHYFEKTSDDFFAQDAPSLFARRSIQLALVDGMHEYHFALRDVENILDYLTDDGVILMHDCNPQTLEAAGPIEAWKSGVWNGDVWKTIVHLRSLRPDLTVFVLDCDHGLGVVTKAKPTTKPLSFTVAEIEKLTYADFSQNRTEWLNLKPEDYACEFFQVRF